MRRWVRGAGLAFALACISVEWTAAEAVELEDAQDRIEALEFENRALREQLSLRDEALALSPAAPTEREGIDADFSFSFHRDSRSYSTLGVVTSIKDLPFGLSIWGITDLHGEQEGSRWVDTARSFSEYRLSRPIGQGTFLDGLGLQVEVNDGSRVEDSLARFGATYRHGLSLEAYGVEPTGGWLQWRAFPVDTTGDGAQLSWIYFLPITERISVGGFADYNLRKGPNRWVIEPELRFRVWKNLTLLLEYRLNESERHTPGLSGSGLAFGIRAAL